MQIGNRDLVSASYTIMSSIAEPLVEGTLSYVVRGINIGDQDKIIILEDIRTSLINVISYRDNRRSDELYGSLARDVMFSLDSELYHVPDGVEFTTIAIPEEPARFDLSLPIETFDKWRLYLIDGPESSRLIYYRFDWSEPREAYIPLGVMDVMLVQLSESIENIVRPPIRMRPISE